MKRAALVVLAACGGKATSAGGAGGADHAPGACTGERMIASQDELAALGRCASIDGDVTIRGASALDFRVVEALEVVGGQLTIGPTFGADMVNLVGLRDVGSLRIVSNGVAGGVYLPKLARAGSIEIAANLGIAQISLPVLEDVTGDLIVEQNPALEMLDLATLAQVGGVLQLRNNAILRIVEIGELQHAGSIDLTGSGVPDDHPLRNFPAAATSMR